MSIYARSGHLGLAGGGEGGAAWTAWGGAASSRFAGEAEGLALDGEVTTFTLGADAVRSRSLAGVAVALSESEGSFRDREAAADPEGNSAGTLESTLTSVHPYARLQVSERLSVWGILGYGTGELTLEVDGTGRWTTDVSMEMAAVGARGLLASAEDTGGLELAARTDAVLTRTSSEAAHDEEAGHLRAAEAQTSRVRLVLEASHTIAVGDGGRLTPRLEMGVRHDGGDAETGAGIEVGGGLRYADPSSGLTADARVRGLVAHEEAVYSEWGASGSVRFDPGASGRGLSLSLTSALGAEQLWSHEDARAFAPEGEAPERAARLEAELGYRFYLPGGRAVATPHARWSHSGESGTLTLGQRLELGGSHWSLAGEFGQDSRNFVAGYGYRLGQSLDLTLEASRREAADDDAPEHGIVLRAVVGW